MRLTAVFEPAEEGGFTSFVEEVAAAISQGETLDGPSRTCWMP
jgi:predicted RNase H-like HicB family nuclease